MSLVRYVTSLDEVHQDYNFLMGYHTGVPKEWYCGIEGITFIFMGDWNDALVGYQGFAINESLITDDFWTEYNEEVPAPADSKEYQEYAGKGFEQYMKEHREEVFERLDEIIETYKEEVAA